MSTTQRAVEAYLAFPIHPPLPVAKPIFVLLIQGAEPSCGGPTSDDIRPGAKPHTHTTDTKNGMPMRHRPRGFSANGLGVQSAIVVSDCHRSRSYNLKYLPKGLYSVDEKDVAF